MASLRTDRNAASLCVHVSCMDLQCCIYLFFDAVPSEQAWELFNAAELCISVSCIRVWIRASSWLHGKRSDVEPFTGDCCQYAEVDAFSSWLVLTYLILSRSFSRDLAFSEIVPLPYFQKLATRLQTTRAWLFYWCSCMIWALADAGSRNGYWYTRYMIFCEVLSETGPRLRHWIHMGFPHKEKADCCCFKAFFQMLPPLVSFIDLPCKEHMRQEYISLILPVQ